MNRRQWLSVLVAALPMWSVVRALERRQPAQRPAPGEGERAPAFTEILKIDIHSHVFEDMPALNEMLRRNNVRTMNVCNNGTDGHLETMHRIALELFRNIPTCSRSRRRSTSPGSTNRATPTLRSNGWRAPSGMARSPRRSGRKSGST